MLGFFVVFCVIIIIRVNSDDTCNDSDKLRYINHDRIGDISSIKLNNGLRDIKTIHLQPLIFEINNYLSDNECDTLIEISKLKGFKTSITQKPEEITSNPAIIDPNSDNKLNTSEMILTLEMIYDTAFNSNDIKKLYDTFDINYDENITITKHELMNKLNPYQLRVYMDKILNKYPHKRSRLSKQSWILYNNLNWLNNNDKKEYYIETLKNIHQRLYNLTKLPKFIIDNSNELQIGGYYKKGRYLAHYDTSTETINECCFVKRKRNFNDNTPCNSCRFMTVLYYLNDVKKGGETVFPFVNINDIQFDDNSQYIYKDYNMESMNMIQWKMTNKSSYKYYCYSDDILKIKPKKGKAIIWYNNLINNHDGWLGNYDKYSIHGGCPVKKGIKWIANHWILVTNDIKIDKSLSDLYNPL